MKNNKSRTVVIIPAYNEEGSIAKVILQAKLYVNRVYVCDDGSTDLTSTIAQAVGAKVIRHSERRGKGEALMTLSKEVIMLNPDIVVSLDGDGQHNPADIPLLIKPIEAGETDVVVGSRYANGGGMDAPFYRKLGLQMMNFLFRKFTGVKTHDTQSGLRAYSRKALEYLVHCDAKGYGIESEQLVKASRNGLRVMEVPVNINYNGLAKTSKKSPLLHGADLLSTLVRLIVEERPLMYLGVPGLGFTCVGIALGLYLLWQFNMTRDFSIPIALLTFGAAAAGAFLMTASIILHGLKRIDEHLRAREDTYPQRT